jgi:hypothetical protein
MAGEPNLLLYLTVFRICDMLVRIRIRGSVPQTKTDPDPDPALLVSDLQDAKKINFVFLIFFAYYFLKVIFLQR